MQGARKGSLHLLERRSEFPLEVADAFLCWNAVPIQLIRLIRSFAECGCLEFRLFEMFLESDTNQNGEFQQGIDQTAVLGLVTVMVGITLETQKELPVIVHGRRACTTVE